MTPPRAEPDRARGPAAGSQASSRHAVLWGLAAIAAYLVAAAVVLHGLPSGAPLYDGGQPPQPYRWVKPPPEFAGQNQPPGSGDQVVPIEGDGTQPSSPTTDDGQAVVSLPENAFPGRPGETAVRVTLTPVGPATLGDPPGGMRFDGNAYRIEARYQASGAEATPAVPVNVVLRYPVHATQMLRRDGSKWETLQTRSVPAGLQVYAETTALGTFVAAAPDDAAPQRSNRLALLLAAGAVVLAGAAVLSRRRPRRWLRKWLFIVLHGGKPPPPARKRRGSQQRRRR